MSKVKIIKLLLLFLYRNNHTNFSCSWQLRKVQPSTPDFFWCFFGELTAFMTVVLKQCESIILLMSYTILDLEIFTQRSGLVKGCVTPD